MNKAYELQIFRRAEWVVDAIFDNRERALEAANLATGRSPLAMIRVTEERFDPDRGTPFGIVIFQNRDIPPDPIELRRQRRQRLQTTEPPDAPVPAAVSGGTPRISAATAGGLALGLFGGLAIAYLASLAT